MRYKFWLMCSVSFLSSAQAVVSVSPLTLFLSAFLPGPAPGKRQIQKINFPGSLSAVPLHQMFPSIKHSLPSNISRLYPSGMAPSQPSHYACYLFLDGRFSTLFDSFPAQRDCLMWFFSILRFLLKTSAWVAQQLLPFSVDIVDSSDGEDTSAELEAILAAVEPHK